MKNTRGTYLALIAALLVPMAANADIITVDFEDVTVVGAFQNFDPVSSRGFELFSEPGPGGVIADPAASCSPDCADNGTQTYFHFNGGTPETTLTEAFGGVFGLVSFDVAEQFSGNPPIGATVIELIGTLFGGGTVSASFSLDGINDSIGGLADFETFFLPASFVGLTSVTFTGDSYFQLDNLNVSVPEPGTLALFGIGLAVLGLTGRRRKS